MEARRSISGAVDLGEDLAGAEVGVAGVEAGEDVVAVDGVEAGAGKKIKANIKSRKPQRGCHVVHLLNSSSLHAQYQRLQASFSIGIARQV